MLNPNDKVTWQGWGKVAPTFINCKGKIIKILSKDGWAIVEKANGSRHYVPVKRLKKII